MEKKRSYQSEQKCDNTKKNCTYNERDWLTRSLVVDGIKNDISAVTKCDLKGKNNVEMTEEERRGNTKNDNNRRHSTTFNDIKGRNCTEKKLRKRKEREKSENDNNRRLAYIIIWAMKGKNCAEKKLPERKIWQQKGHEYHHLLHNGHKNDAQCSLRP